MDHALAGALGPDFLSVDEVDAVEVDADEEPDPASFVVPDESEEPEDESEVVVEVPPSAPDVDPLSDDVDDVVLDLLELELRLSVL